MKKSLLAALLAGLCILPFSTQVQAEQYKAALPSASQKKAVPLVERFPTINPKAYQVPVYRGRIAKDISDRHHSFRTYLRRALKGGVNFGGHYVLTMPGCGTSCLNPIVVDVKTGRIYDLDIAPMSGFFSGGSEGAWSDMDIHYTQDSTLLYFAGSLGDGYGTGSFLLNFKGGKFHIISYSNIVQYNLEDNE